MQTNTRTPRVSRGLLLTIGLALAAHGQPARDLRIDLPERINPLKDRGTRWALVVGISSYRYLPPGAQLRFAHRDAEEFAEFLRTTAGGAIPGSHIRLLENDEASLAGIRAALETWLVDSAQPEDIVYVYFAGHGVLDERDNGYFVASDSDPQNLHATALSFAELDQTLSSRLRASLVVFIADACHTGRLGWSSYSPAEPSRAGEPLARIGQGDRSFLKLLAARPSERSFEDEKLGGGHGIFTYSLLEGLNGKADADSDRVVRVSEAIDYVSRRVPEMTQSQQHPRVAGTFDARIALAALPGMPAPVERMTLLDVFGPARSAVYIDNVFRGRIRAGGTVRVESLRPGRHIFSADFADGATLDGIVTLSELPARVTIASPASGPLAQLRARLASGRVLEAGGAWDFYRAQTFAGTEKAAATALLSGSLEELGQACVSDYVQSAAPGLKRALLARSVDAYDRLQTLRPYDSGLVVKKLFCEGRLRIAEGRFPEAVVLLEKTLQLDRGFACAYNALGVALSRMKRPKEARAAFETAARLTPEWALPPFQIASQLIASGELAKAVPYLERAVSYSPRVVGTRWSLMHLYRLLKRTAQAEQEAAELIRINPNYPPIYTELGLAYEADGKLAKAAEAFDTYVMLAPNFADTNEVRALADRLRKR